MSCARSDFSEEVWIDRANRVEWVVGSTDPVTGAYTAVTDLSGLTRAVFVIGSVTVDSDNDATLIWWTDSVSSKTLPDGSSYTGDVLRATPGLVSGLSAGEYDDCRVVIYDATYIDGLVVADNIHVTVYAAAYS